MKWAPGLTLISTQYVYDISMITPLQNYSFLGVFMSWWVNPSPSRCAHEARSRAHIGHQP